MIGLHVSFIDGVPFLWGEQANAKSKMDNRAYPLDPGISGLKEAFKRIASQIKVLKSNTTLKVVWLPSRGNEPIPSSPVIAPAPDQRRKIGLGPYRTTARELVLEEFLELTALAESGDLTGSGVILGRSFFWANRFLKTILKAGLKETFLPGLVDRGGVWEGRFIPVLDEADEKDLQTLTATMPGVCRCMGESVDSPPETSPDLVVNQALAYGLDCLVRQANKPVKTRAKAGNNYSSLHDAWLAALVSSDGVVHWSKESEVREFAAQLDQWRRPVDLAAKSPFKFCFRLSEPIEDPGAEDSNDWRVDYLLQPKADPSLLVSALDAWKAKSNALKQLKKFGGDVTEFMLTALGQASGLCPGIAGSLKQKHPGGFSLDTTGAFQFLSEQAGALGNAGFTVMLPSWWIGRGPVNRLRLKAKVSNPQMQGDAAFSLSSMVEFDLAACLGEDTLNIEELRQLARLKSPLVKLRGQWTEIDQDQIQAAIRFLEKQGQGEMSARDLVGLALGAEQRMGGLSVDSVETDGWLRDVLDKLSGHRGFEQIAQPENFVGSLRPYQERGLSWLNFLCQWGLGACLADDMGLGKTIQTLALLQRERANGEKRPALLVCPTSVVNNWKKEVEKFTPDLKTLIHHGPDRSQNKSFAKAVTEHALVVTSYGLLHRDAEFLAEIDWAGVILDEAQNIKNSGTRQAKAAKRLDAGYRIALTGTPVENNVGDLWSLMDFLNPGLLGTQSVFKQTFFRPIQIWQNEDTANRLKKLTGPFILRRLKTDRSIISDLPDKIEQKEYCRLTREQASLYQAVLDDMFEGLEKAEGIQRRGMVLAALSKLKQVCNHPAQFIGDGSSLNGRSGKLLRLEEILEEIEGQKERTLIFTQFAQMGELLHKYLQEQFGREVLFLHGGVARKKRDEMVERFQNEPEGPHVFILSLKAGGTGLNLTRANHVVHFDRWWNPAVENQATDRVFRIGQQKNVLVHKFIVAGTLEERIDEMIQSKTDLAERIVGAGENWITELSNEDFRELTRLGREAVED